jgi:hypothetical protein
MARGMTVDGSRNPLAFPRIHIIAQNPFGKREVAPSIDVKLMIPHPVNRGFALVSICLLPLSVTRLFVEAEWGHFTGISRVYDNRTGPERVPWFFEAEISYSH